MKKVTASELISLIEGLYLLVIDYVAGGKPSAELSAQIKKVFPKLIKRWEGEIPGLQGAARTALSGRDRTEALYELGTNIKNVYQTLRSNRSFTDSELDLLRAFVVYLRSDSEGALKKIGRFAGSVGNTWIANQFVPERGDQGSAKKQLLRIVKKLTGENRDTLTGEEILEFKGTEELKAYRKLKREFGMSWKNELISFIRGSGKRMVPYQKVIQHLNSLGLEFNLPSGFTGLIDDQGKFYTAEGDLINGVPSAAIFPKVKMNEAGNGSWVFQAFREDGSPGNYFYRVKDLQERTKEKFAKVEDLIPKMQAVRKKWIPLVKNFDVEQPKTVAATILEILYAFSARIGSRGNAAGGESTFGISTLLVKHVFPQPNGDIVLRYKGKGGVATVHRLKKTDPVQRLVINNILKLMEEKKPSERLFSVWKGSKWKPILGSQVNVMFRQMGANGLTVHKIRTYYGTVMFMKIAEEKLARKRPKTEKEAIQQFKEIALMVGKQLNHVRRTASGEKVTGATAIGSYISPEVMVDYFTQLGFRPPRVIVKTRDA